MIMSVENIIVAVLALVGTLVGTFGGIITSTKLSNFRIDQLEKKVEKHNNVTERTSVIERDLKTMWKNIDELNGSVRSLVEHNRKEE